MTPLQIKNKYPRETIVATLKILTAQELKPYEGAKDESGAII